MLFQLQNIKKTVVVKRPSLYCKTPYVADVYVDNDVTTMAHTPALGCSGLSDKDATVYVTPMKNKNTKCTHRIDLATYREGNKCTIVGINPNLAEIIVKECLQQSKTSFLPKVHSFDTQQTFLNSRFDFCGKDQDDNDFVLEVKNVPLADYVDVPKKDKKKALEQVSKKVYQDKIAYFPDGYRKLSEDVISPRALKHVNELTEIAQNTKTRAILCFVVQRSDVGTFQPSNIDMQYKHAVQEAWIKGVEIRCIQVCWNAQGICTFVRDNIPIHIFDIYGPYRL
jgi:DNA-binding sugar fermentation-stimulating protein